MVLLCAAWKRHCTLEFLYDLIYADWYSTFTLNTNFHANLFIAANANIVLMTVKLFIHVPRGSTALLHSSITICLVSRTFCTRNVWRIPTTLKYLKPDIRLNIVHKFISYLTENTLYIHYEDKMVNDV